MTARTAEVISMLRNDVDIDRVVIRPVSFKGWGLYLPTSESTAEVLYTAPTQEECYRLLQDAREGE